MLSPSGISQLRLMQSDTMLNFILNTAIASPSRELGFEYFNLETTYEHVPYNIMF